MTTRKATAPAAPRAEPTPLELSPELTDELSRRSDEARENARAGRTISAEEQITRMRAKNEAARSKQRRAG